MADDVLRTESTPHRDSAPSGAVVAALDGSPADGPILDWAGDQAARSGAPLHLVSVVEPGYQLTPYEMVLSELPSLSEQLEVGVRAILDEARERVTGRHPELAVSTGVEWGAAAATLVDLSRGAVLLVVGAPARSRLQRMVLGSVAMPTVAHATCSVAVVPSGVEAAELEHLVVGVDGSPDSARAAWVALSMAAAAGARVTCVVGWSVEVSPDGVVVTEPGTERWQAVEDRYRVLLERTIEPAVSEFAEVPVEIVVRCGAPASAVLEQAAESDAQVVVVGSRGRGGFSGLLLGSVSKRIVEHADRVVVVAR